MITFIKKVLLVKNLNSLLMLFSSAANIKNDGCERPLVLTVDSGNNCIHLYVCFRENTVNNPYLKFKLI